MIAIDSRLAAVGAVVAKHAPRYSVAPHEQGAVRLTLPDALPDRAYDDLHRALLGMGARSIGTDEAGRDWVVSF